MDESLDPHPDRLSFSRLWRPLPDFLIIGAQKAGTTSLYAYLAQHPQVLKAATKEIHFFSTQHERGESWYRRQFPSRAWLALRRMRAGGRVITGEATPYYLFHPHAARWIARTVPRVQLIVLLRDPVSRAFSHYNHEVRIGTEKLPFEQAIRSEQDRIGGEARSMLADERYASFNHQHYSYLARGVYVDQLLVYREYFGPHQMLILTSDELFADPPSAYSKTLRFLGLNDHRLRDTRARHVGAYERGSSIPMRQELEDYFRPHNRRLFEYLQRDLGWPATAVNTTPGQDAPAGPGTKRAVIPWDDSVD